ncbi:MAG: hypothetical protein GC159_05130 [Phycisphaera sp.]|nr:hypothetical protein [Phycisphaera sp.]
MPAHYEEHSEQVLVEPARCEKRWVPPVYETRCDRWGRHVEVLVREGYWQTIEIPARYETRCVKVLVPGHWEEIDYRDVHDVHFGHDNGVGHAYGRDH